MSRMNWWNEWIFCMLGKLNVNNYWVRILKNEWDLLDHESLKSGVSHKWCDGSSRLNDFAC